MSAVNFFEMQNIGKREEQQDSLANSVNLKNGYRLHVLADGMGGHKAGSTASKTVCEAFLKYFEQKPMHSPMQSLQEALAYANQSIAKILEKQPNLKGMGTTLVALIYNEISNEYAFISVGDSPLYLFNDSGLSRINQNHAYYEKLLKMVEANVITQEQADTDPQRHAITSAVMGTEITEVDLSQGILKPNDLLLIGSDGIQTLEDSRHGELWKIISNNQKNIEQTINNIFEAIKNKDNEYQDNISAILMKYVEHHQEMHVATAHNSNNNYQEYNSKKYHEKAQEIEKSNPPVRINILKLLLVILFIVAVSLLAIYYIYGKQEDKNIKEAKINDSVSKPQEIEFHDVKLQSDKKTEADNGLKLSISSRASELSADKQDINNTPTNKTNLWLDGSYTSSMAHGNEVDMKTKVLIKTPKGKLDHDEKQLKRDNNQYSFSINIGDYIKKYKDENGLYSISVEILADDKTISSKKTEFTIDTQNPNSDIEKMKSSGGMQLNPDDFVKIVIEFSKKTEKGSVQLCHVMYQSNAWGIYNNINQKNIGDVEQKASKCDFIELKKKIVDGNTPSDWIVVDIDSMASAKATLIDLAGNEKEYPLIK